MQIGSATNSAGSALRVEALRLQASAHNIANLQTAGFDPVQVEAQSQPGGGVSARIVSSDRPNPTVNLDGQSLTTSNTDLATELVNQMRASNAYKANVKTLQTADEMSGTALDLVA